MIDNSSWLKRLLIKTEKRKQTKNSLRAIVKHNKNFYNASTLLWFISLIFIFIYVFIELGLIPNYFLEMRELIKQATAVL